eukprot:1469178-Pleurochrysis_carterae.AAC.2
MAKEFSNVLSHSQQKLQPVVPITIYKMSEALNITADLGIRAAVRRAIARQRRAAPVIPTVTKRTHEVRPIY